MRVRVTLQVATFSIFTGNHSSAAETAVAIVSEDILKSALHAAIKFVHAAIWISERSIHLVINAQYVHR